nr:hypothetical protein [Tanacetum cinerariifolium]
TKKNSDTVKIVTNESKAKLTVGVLGHLHCILS